MFKNYLQLMLRLSIFVFSLSAFAQTPPTITGSGTATSAICSGTGSIAVNLTAGATPYNLVNSDLSALPTGAVVGGENYTPTFTAGNPHYVQLTPAENVKRGFITFAETALKPVAFSANFGLYVGNGTGADGTSFNYGNVNTSTYNYGEAGMIDSGLAIGFHDNTNKIKVYYNNVELQSFNVQGTLNNSGWKPVSIELTASGQLTLSYNGYVYCLNYQLPAAYVTDNKTTWQYGFAARCGGLNNLHAINDVVIKDRTPMQYSIDNTFYSTSSTFYTLAGNYNVYARIGDAAYNSHGFNSTTQLGTSTITDLSVTATLTPTNPSTCSATGSIAISNVTHNFVPYDLVNISLTNGQLGAATIGNLGSGSNPFWGQGDLVLTPPSNNKAGYIAFNTTVAHPNAFSANYDVFVGGGNGGDGLSFNYGVLNTAGTAGAAESGMVNSGLAIGFSDYHNTIKIYYNKTELQSYSATVNSGSYKSVAITVTQDGKLTIVHGGITICSNYQLPAAYATDNKSSWQYALAARTGGSTNYHSVKNVVIKDNDIQYSADNVTYTTATTLTGLATGQYSVFARQSNGVHCTNTFQVGTATITYTPDITATVTATSPTTCTIEGGTITISNVSPGLSSPYDLVNISLTNNQLGAATIGNLGTCCNPIWGGFGDLVLTPNTSNRAGYIAFNSTVAQPNAFSANYDVFVGGGNGGDGLSFNYGNLNTSGSLGGAESGIVNSGLAIGFSDYSNTIKIYYNKVELQSYNQNLNANSYKSVAITVTQDGKLTLVYGGTTICSNYQLPAAYATDNKSSWQYALAARCGASNNYHSVKNVVIKDNSIQYTINGINYTENPNFTNVYQGTYNVRARISNGAHCAAISTLGSATIAPPPGMIAITGQPATANQSVAQNATATALTVTATGTATISYQWLSNTVAINNGGNPIVGANSASYTPPTSATGTLYYYCALSNACSEVNSAISGSVTTNVPAPNISYTTPVTYTVGTSISPLTPTNTGGNPVGVLNNVSTLAGSGSVGSTDDTGNAASFNGPQQLALDSSGNIYVADQFNNKIRKITPAGVVSTLAISTSFDGPAGVAIDNIGNLYVSDTYNNRIVKITTSGVVSTFAGSGSQGNSDGNGTAASFKWPNQLTVDKHNNIYLADAGNNSVRKITPAGLVTTVASIPLAPEALIVDDADNVYVVNNGNNVYKITSGGVVSIFAGSSAPGSVDAIGTAASFNSPYGINLDTNGNLYVGDFGNNKIRKITPNGVVTTFAGGSTSSSVDGSLTTAGFSGPTGIVFDAQGKMYVADYTGNKIRVISGAAYTITPALPAGLSMNGATGVISGTPTVASAATDYVVSAANAGGSSSFTISIQIIAAPTASAQTFCNSATVADLVATGTDLQWYDVATGGTALSASTAIASGTYYVSQTVSSTESSRTLVSVTVNVTSAPTASAQTFCNSASVADLVATGTDLKYYDVATGGTALSASTAVASGTYYVSQTLTSCESTRTSVAVTVTTTAAPTASAQTFSGNSTVANLVASGTNLKWYDVATGGTALASTTVIATGTYYVSQTSNNCESSRTSVAVTLNITTAPTASAQTLCSGRIVADLVATGTDLKWYAVATNGTALASSTVLASGNYFVSQTVNSVESDRTSVAVTVNTTSAPSAAAQTFCSGSTVADLVATGTDLQWYPTPRQFTALASTIAITSRYYFVTQTLNSCESTRTTVEVTVNTTAAPTASAQTFCGSKTIADLVGTGTNLKWYDVATNGTALATSTALATGTYYVSQTLNSCESANTSVSVTVNTTPPPTADAQTFCTSGTVGNLVASGTDLQWYDVATNGTALTNETALVTATTYYVSQTINSCESTRTSVVVTVDPTSVAGTISGAGTICENDTKSLSIPTSSVGTIQWQVSTVGTTSGFGDINGANGRTYVTDALTATSYFRAVVTSGVCTSQTTPAVTVTVTPLNAGIISGGDVTVCAYATSGLDLSGTSTTFSNSTSLSVAGSVGTKLWQKSINYVNATGATPVWTSALSTTNALTVTNLTVDTWYRVKVTNGTCTVSSTPVKITVSKVAKAGTINSASSVCTGGDITFISSAYTGSSIQWEVSTTSATSGFAPIANTNQLNFTMSAVSYAPLSTFYVRNVVTSGNCTIARSAVKTITVNPLAFAGPVIGGGTICSGSNVTMRLTGYIGAVQWQSSTDGINYFNEPSGSSTHTASNITVDTYLRAKVTSGACSVVYSNVVKYTIGTATAGSLVAANTTVCKGSGTTLTLTGSDGTIKWFKSTNWSLGSATWSLVSSSTSGTLTVGNLTASTAFKAEVTVGSCSTLTSEVVPVYVYASPLAKTITANVTSPSGTTSALAICTTSTTSKELIIGANSIGAIQWQRSSTSATTGFTDITDATGTSYIITNPTVGANYFRAKFTNSCGVSVFGTAFRVYYKACIPTKANTSSEFSKAPFAAVSYPNPFTNNFNLNVTSSSSEKVSVVVYDMIGRVLEKHLENVSEINSLAIGNNYPTGVYNIIVTQGMEVKTVRVIKK